MKAAMYLAISITSAFAVVYFTNGSSMQFAWLVIVNLLLAILLEVIE